MAYANTLSKKSIQFFRWFNTACLLVTLLVCFDIFLLPRTISHEKILSRKDIFVTTKSKYSQHPRTTHLENVILTTENYRYAYNRMVAFNTREADSIRLVTTKLFNIVETGYIKYKGVERELTPGTGIFGNLNFIPIAFGLVALLGVLMRNNNEQLLNAAVVNAMLIILELWVLDYISF